jgi:hypothetical protein
MCTPNRSLLLLDVEIAANAPKSAAATTPAVPSHPPPESIVNVYELSFGTLAGICAGVFIKKGAKLVAIFVGGVFVLLQVSSAQPFLFQCSNASVFQSTSTHSVSFAWTG